MTVLKEDLQASLIAELRKQVETQRKLIRAQHEKISLLYQKQMRDSGQAAAQAWELAWRKPPQAVSGTGVLAMLSSLERRITALELGRWTEDDRS